MIVKSQWPILLVSHDLQADSDDGFRLRELVGELEKTQECAVIPSQSYEDAAEVFASRADIGCVIVDWDLPFENPKEKMPAAALIDAVRQRNRSVPLLLLTDRLETENIPTFALEKINGCLWKTADTVPFLAGRIEEHLVEYVKSVYPAFFGMLTEYAEKYKYAWHTPGHLGGQGFLRAPAGVAMFKFFGENTFRSDLSISVPELGSLLDHEGVVGDAERNSAKVFGADLTYYVLNGTSTVNQIIWRSQVLRDDVAFVDRNCHKSLNYAMVITEAIPIYMIPRRNKRGIIGPVSLSEFTPDSVARKIADSALIPPERKKDVHVKMSALTNSTYDGVCYNTAKIKERLDRSVANLHFDEAWYAYARFNKMYEGFYGMTPGEVKKDDPPIFCSQSTHKLLTAFSQASMLHIRPGGTAKINPDEFNESYMMHGSTSPQYSMIASLDVATKMMQDSGEMLIHDIIREAVQLRRRTAKLNREFAAAKDWFFNLWQPREFRVNGKSVKFEDMDIDYLATHHECWVLSSSDPWHGFENIEDNYVMLDPIKLTFTTPGIDDAGKMQDFGIPASVVTNYLINHNIVCEKTDYYSFLMLNSLGTTRAKQGTLLAALLQFKRDFDSGRKLSDVFPDLVAMYPERYGQATLRSHCLKMHEYIKAHAMLDKMQAAFEVIPKQVMRPAEAYHKVVAREVEYVLLDEMSGRVPAVMMVPYPPGIPIVMGGERLDRTAQPILDYLQTREAFEAAFPGYEGDIHGVEREVVNGKTKFKTLCIRKECEK